MATHSSVLAWRIPGTGEPGGLPSMGLHRVGHDRSDLAAAASSYNNKISFFLLLSASSYLSYISILVFPLSFFFFFSCILNFKKGFPSGANGKEPACQCRRHKRCGFNPLVRKIQCSCLENPMDRGAQQATVHRVTKS